MGTGELLGKPNNNCGEVTCDGLASRPGGAEILLAASCYGNRDKLRQHKPVLASRLHFFYGMESSKVVLSVLASRWLILFCVWDRLSWPEFLPHLPYQTDQRDSELTLIL